MSDFFPPQVFRTAGREGGNLRSGVCGLASDGPAEWWSGMQRSSMSPSGTSRYSDFVQHFMLDATFRMSTRGGEGMTNEIH